ncbi:hypothetical protein O181_080206 [Austropuccinia psidii MF-1]|uniref:Uncharacterized protein n=1 Tax=Austropuccinia psidii MF-1 TaxID=1389203 RepID=A0A9Q3IEQ8_9BASI|nr:hypothetical protein [Austropuccinia psidii MF-1]
MEICTCPKYKEFQCTNQDAQQNQGVLVSQSTCNRHWAKTAKQGTIPSDLVSQISIEEDNSNNTSEVSSYKSETLSSFSDKKDTSPK